MQQLNPSEISDLIRQRIDQLDVSSEARNVGTIVSVTDGIIRIHGLTDVMYGEMIEFDGGIYGMALNLERDSVGAVSSATTRAWRKASPAAAPAAFWKYRWARNCRAASSTPWVPRSMARARSTPP
jgi:F0F1-type ATP synthase alpha subunit